MGTVKDLFILEKPFGNKMGKGRFIFSNRYSVFDFGEMPDKIPDKGSSLCLISAYFFEKLEREGIRTHYKGVVEDKKIKSLSELKKPSEIMEIELVRVIKPTYKDGVYNYSIFKKEKGNFLLPLEIIYRNTLPEGSSVFKRLETGEIKPSDLGLDHYPEPNEILEKPLLDFSTKLEHTDRYITKETAKKIAGLNNREMEQILNILERINKFITDSVKALGLYNQDGKIELGFTPEREIFVIDTVGTPDECRISFEQIPLSKECIRMYYRKTDWFKEIENIKREKGREWRKYAPPPPPLPSEFKKIVSQMYKSIANKITNREWFKVPDLIEIINRLKEWV